MKDNKTQPAGASVQAYLAAIVDATRQSDCAALLATMSRITGEPAKMWGSSIVGFGSYHYTYESGRQGDACLTGFSSRKGDISVYLAATAADQDRLLAQLGRHKMGKACLYVRHLSDVDLDVLERLIAASIVEIKRLYD